MSPVTIRAAIMFTTSGTLMLSHMKVARPSAVVLTVGFRLDSRPLRWFALGLFGVTLVKVALIDTAELRGLYRVAVFLALSLMMGLGAWGYQKVRQALLPHGNKETPS